MFSQVYDSFLNFACFHKLLTEAAYHKNGMSYIFTVYHMGKGGKTCSKCTRKYLLEVYLKRSFLLLFKDPVTLTELKEFMTVTFKGADEESDILMGWAVFLRTQRSQDGVSGIFPEIHLATSHIIFHDAIHSDNILCNFCYKTYSKVYRC